MLGAEGGATIRSVSVATIQVVTTVTYLGGMNGVIRPSHHDRLAINGSRTICQKLNAFPLTYAVFLAVQAKIARAIAVSIMTGLCYRIHFSSFPCLPAALLGAGSSTNWLGAS